LWKKSSPDYIGIYGPDHVGIFDVSTGADLSKTWPASPAFVVMGLGFSGDGKRFGVAGQKAILFDSMTLREIQQLPGGFVEATGGFYSNRDGTAWAAANTNGVRLWTARQSWKPLPGSLDGNSALPYQLAFSRNGRRLVSGGLDNTVRIWDVETAKEAATLYHEAAEGIRIKAVAYSPDERQIYAIGDNASIYRFPVSLDDLIVEAKKRLK